MSLQIQIPYRGDQYLAQGISQAGQGLAAGIESMTANLKKAKAYRTMAVDALGMDPDEVDKMALPELEGHFQAVAVKQAAAKHQAELANMQSIMEGRQAQMEDWRAQAQARTQKAQMDTDEANAWPMLMQQLQQQQPAAGGPNPADMMSPGAAGAGVGPAATGGTGSSGGTPFSPEALMGAMSKMGATSPRLAAALSRTIIPQLMGNVGTEPKAWMSPEGNPYVFKDHTLMADRAPLDVAAMMGQAPTGFEAVQSGPNKIQYLKTGKELPSSFHSVLDKVTEDIASAESTLQQPDTAFKNADDAKTMRGYAQKRMESARARGKATIDRYHLTGHLNPDQKDELYVQLGLAPAKAAPAAAAPAAATDAPKVGDVRKGFRFKGGNPADPKNWEKAQ